MTIAVFNRQRKIRFDLIWLKKIARVALAEICAQPAAGKETEAALSRLERVEIVIVSDEKIAVIHEQFMGISGATDVITFEHGEIVISAETAKRNAAHFSQSLEHELARYIIHGLLHLDGYDDQALADAARMRRVQEKILRACLSKE